VIVKTFHGSAAGIATVRSGRRRCISARQPLGKSSRSSDGQVYLERILGLGYHDTQLKIQVHFLMLIATAAIFTVGVGLFIWDYFRARPPLRKPGGCRAVAS